MRKGTRKLHKVAAKIFNYTRNGRRGSKPDTLSAVNLTILLYGTCTYGCGVYALDKHAVTKVIT